MTTNLNYEYNNDNPQERKKYIRNMFDSIVPTYDMLNGVLSMGIDKLWRRKLIKLSGDIKSKRVLDICCGTGELSKMFDKKGADIYSLDFSVEMLKMGRKKGWLTPATVGGDATKLPFAENKFLVLSISFGIRNIPDIKNFVGETLRVLDEGGRLYILELTRPQNRLVAFFYNFYLGKILPFVGGIFSGKREAYSYLAHTIDTFIEPDNLVEMFVSGGFAKVNIYKQTLGVSTIFECVK